MCFAERLRVVDDRQRFYQKIKKMKEDFSIYLSIVDGTFLLDD